MKKVGGDIFLDLKRTATSVVKAFKITRPVDGKIVGLTTADVAFDYLDVTYKPTNAFAGMASSAKSNLSVDNTSATALLTEEFTREELLAGMWDNASVEMFWINPEHPEHGHVPIRGGKMGEVKVKDQTFEVELRSMMQLLQQPFGEHYTLECSADFGDRRCKVQLDLAERWAPSTRYIAKAGADAGIGSYVRPPTENGFWYQCIAAVGGAAEIASTPHRIQNPPRDLDYSGLTQQQKDILNGPDSEEKTALLFQLGSQFQNGDFDIDGASSDGLKFLAKMFKGTDNANITEEGISDHGGSYYENEIDASGVIVDSGRYITPTKEGKVPLSAPPGTQPYTVINGSTRVIYKLGTSGATEPAWPTTLGATIVDNQLTWKAIRHRRAHGTVSAIFSRTQFVDNSRTEPLDYWKYGALTWLTGENAGLRVEIRSYSQGGDNGGFILFEKMPFEIMPGDTYELELGCAKTRTMCKSYDNIHNFRGFPDMPTEERALATPNITARGTAKKQDSGGS